MAELPVPKSLQSPRRSVSVQSRFMLAELRRLHGNVLAAIEELSRLTVGPSPTRPQLCRIRWTLSKASLDRRMLWGKIHLHLAPLVKDESSQRNLLRLQQLDIELLRASIKHVSQWTPEAALADWPGYGRASDRMRAAMMANIAAEKAILYPLLSTLGDARGVDYDEPSAVAFIKGERAFCD